MHRIGERQDVGYRVIGVATDTTDHRFVDDRGAIVPVVAAITDVADRARELGAEAVIIAGRTPGDGEFIRELGWHLEGTGAELVLVQPASPTSPAPGSTSSPSTGLPLIQVEIPQFEGGKHVIKRGFDVIGRRGSACSLFAPMLARDRGRHQAGRPRPGPVPYSIASGATAARSGC